MPIFRSFKYGLAEVTAMVVDDTGTRYLWAAFEKSGGFVTVKKLDAFSVDRLFTEVSVGVDKIIQLIDNASFVYGASEHPSILAVRFLKSSPSSFQINFLKPIGVLENPVALILDGTRLYVLTPGQVSGEFAKLVRYSNVATLSHSGNSDLIISLDESGKQIRNAKSIAVDTNNNLWIVTGNNPAELIRVYQDSLGNYQYDVTILTL